MLAFGSYVPSASGIHKTNAQVKIILACALSICSIACTSWVALGAFWLALIAGFCVARLGMRQMLGGIAPVAVLLAFTVLAHTLSPVSSAQAGMQAADAAASSVGSLGLTQRIDLLWGMQATLDGFAIGLFFALRIALVIAACALLTATTSQTAVVQALQRFLRPLRYVRVPVDDICMIVSMALRFIPTVTGEFYAVKRARQARGAAFEGGGALAAVRAWTHALTPLFVALFRHADILARAMDARCYGAMQRSSLYESKMRARDAAVCFAGLAAMAAIVVLL